MEFRELVEGKGEVGDIEPLARTAGEGLGGVERELVRAMPTIISMLDDLDELDRFRVRQVVVTLTQGMELDLTYFREEGVTGFETPEQLDEYTYLVAGCVGSVLDGDVHGALVGAGGLGFGRDEREGGEVRQGPATDQHSQGRAQGPSAGPVLSTE